ncbi:MAG: hypothetical protein RL318_2733 [Fibrobacterota bacterium]|jgi:hypothetical protein
MNQKHSTLSFGLALLLAVLSSRADARLSARSVSGSMGQSLVNLVDSRVKITVGPHWIDVEEEAELQVPADNYSAGDDILVEGTLTLPPHAAMVGCLLWNNDTLLMGKLRGRADAEHKFDSLVPSRPVQLAKDPLLLDMQDDSTYGFKLYPFSPGGSRRFRIRYLLPLTASREFEILPLMARMVRWEECLPAQFTLQVRGTRSDIRLVTREPAWPNQEVVWPLTLPADRRMDLPPPYTSSIKLRLGTPGAPDGTIAARVHLDSGAWQGDYVFYSAKVPDSILTKVGVRSETVVLWRWIQPQTFVGSNYDGGQKYLNSDGDKAIQQAQSLVTIGDQLTGRGDRFGLVADLGLDDSLQIYPVADSGTREYRNLRSFLTGINREYLFWRINPSIGSGTSNPNNLELSRNRLRFRTDLQKVGSLYSKDSSLIKHLLVVTVGPVPSGGDQLEIPDDAALPKDVSVATSGLETTSRFDQSCWCYRYSIVAGTSSWPGVNLAELGALRPGTKTLVSQGGVMLPKSKTVLAATLSMETGAGRMVRDAILRKGEDGKWRTSFNVHAPKLGTTVRWNFWSDNGDSVAKLEMTPAWEGVVGDSVLPRLWARSEAPLSLTLRSTELAPIFGFVDPLYSLLAMPSDSLGRERQYALRDSGVPFLSSAEIFPRVGYNGEGGGQTGIRLSSVQARGLKLAYLQARRVVTIDLADLKATSVEIHDLRGRLLVRFADVAGRKQLEWDLRTSNGAMVPKGMVIVSVQTAQGRLSGSVLIH